MIPSHRNIHTYLLWQKLSWWPLGTNEAEYTVPLSQAVHFPSLISSQCQHLCVPASSDQWCLMVAWGLDAKEDQFLSCSWQNNSWLALGEGMWLSRTILLQAVSIVNDFPEGGDWVKYLGDWVDIKCFRLLIMTLCGSVLQMICAWWTCSETRGAEQYCTLLISTPYECLYLYHRWVLASYSIYKCNLPLWFLNLAQKENRTR